MLLVHGDSLFPLTSAYPRAPRKNLPPPRTSARSFPSAMPPLLDRSLWVGSLSPSTL